MLLEALPWLLFLGFVGAMLALDLGVFHRHAHTVSRREALVWSVVWIGLALAFSVGVYVVRGTEAGVEWTTGYLADLRYLKPALAAVLVFVGTKMLMVDVYKVPAVLSLGVIVATLGLAIGASLLVDRREAQHLPGEVTPDEAEQILEHAGRPNPGR